MGVRSYFQGTTKSGECDFCWGDFALNCCIFGILLEPSYLLDGAFLFLFGFFIFGPQMLIGMAAAELSHKHAAATATGFAGTFAYLGAAAAGAPLGAITKLWGWDSFLIALAVCSAAAALALLLPSLVSEEGVIQRKSLSKSQAYRINLRTYQRTYKVPL